MSTTVGNISLCLSYQSNKGWTETGRSLQSSPVSFVTLNVPPPPFPLRDCLTQTSRLGRHSSYSPTTMNKTTQTSLVGPSPLFFFFFFRYTEDNLCSLIVPHLLNTHPSTLIHSAVKCSVGRTVLRLSRTLCLNTRPQKRLPRTKGFHETYTLVQL